MPSALGATAISSVLYEWQTLGYRYRLCRGGHQIEGWLALEPLDARWALRSRLASTQASRSLLNSVLGSDRRILPANLGEPGVLERELDHRRLTVLAQPLPDIFPRGAPAAAAPKIVPRTQQSRLERAWIDVTVVDDSVPPQPLRGIRFAISLPDGSRREGVLDGEGHLRIEDIAPGKCFLELTELRAGLKP